MGDGRRRDDAVHLKRVRCRSEDGLQSLEDDLRVDVLEGPLGWYFCDAVGLHESDPHLARDVVEVGEVLAHDQSEGLVAVQRPRQGKIDKKRASDYWIIDGKIDLCDLNGKILSNRRDEDYILLFYGVTASRIHDLQLDIVGYLRCVYGNAVDEEGVAGESG